MQTLSHPLMWPRITSGLLAALATGSAVYWALLLSAPTQSPPVPAVQLQAEVNVDSAALNRALGGAAVADAAGSAPGAVSRFALVGVLAEGTQRGAALLTVDGKSARPVAVGAVVDGDWVLQAVRGRRAVLHCNGCADGAADVTLEMPPLATITLR